jgi:pimeloyl-ACP methyl ester carboxylesterase
MKPIIYVTILVFGFYGNPSPLAGEGVQRFWQKITWNTLDGVKLVGLYHPSVRPGVYTWILLHGLGSNKEEWETFARKLVKHGNGVFIYDARGHGESSHLITGEATTYQDWQNAGPGSPWDAMPSDLASAVQVLQKRFGLSEKKIAVGGASLGANVALVYACNHPRVPALVLLSPGMEYAGIQSAATYKVYSGRPVFIAASPGDLYAYSSVRQLTDLASSLAQVVANGRSGHGVQMFQDEEFTKKLLEWMRGMDGNRDRRPS